MRRLLLALPLALVLLASPLSSAAQPWPTAPASDAAGQMSELFWFTLVLAGIVFVLVEGLLIYSSLRFRRRSALPTVEPPQIHGNTRLEVMWASVPALILVGLFGITVTRLGELSQIPTDPKVMHISVTGRQFSWEFGYGNSGVKTTNDLHLPVGQQVVFDVSANRIRMEHELGPQLFAAEMVVRGDQMLGRALGTNPAVHFELTRERPWARSPLRSRSPRGSSRATGE